MRNKNIFSWLVLIFAIIIIIFCVKACNNGIRKENSKLIESLNDSISYYRDVEGILHSKISVIEDDYFLKLKLKDKEIAELQDLVKKYKNVKSATIIKTETKIVEKIVNKTVLDTISNTPIYESSFNLKDYIWGNIVAKKDTTDIKINIKNDFNIVTYKERGKLVLDVSAGYGISKSGLSPYIGLGVNYNILNF